MSTEDLIEEVLRLDGEATPGPWEQGRMVDAGDDGPEIIAAAEGDMVRGVCDCGFDSSNAARDARLIATYRTACPELAREVERLARELADWQSGRKYAGGHDGQPIDVARRVYKTVADALGLTAEERRAWCPAEKIATLRAEAARLRAAIEGAPHGELCLANGNRFVCTDPGCGQSTGTCVDEDGCCTTCGADTTPQKEPGPCGCWKASALKGGAP